MKVYIAQKVIDEVKRFFTRNRGELIWNAVRAILTRHFKLIDDSNYSVEKYRGMIKDKDLEHLAAFNDSKLDMLIAYDRDFKEIHGYVTPREFLIKINENPVNKFEF